MRKNNRKGKSRTKKVSSRNNSSEEIRSAYREYLRTMPNSE